MDLPAVCTNWKMNKTFGETKGLFIFFLPDYLSLFINKTLLQPWQWPRDSSLLGRLA